MRLLRQPSLRAATQATFVQRAVAFSAMLLAVSVVLFWPSIRNTATSAYAQTQDNNYQPFSCSQPGASGLQDRRANLTLKNGSGGSSAAKAYPCISGVAWKLQVGCTTCTVTNGAGSNGVVAILNNAFSTTGATLPVTGTTNTATGLTQVSIQGLQFCSAASVPSATVNGFGCRKAVDNIRLTANSTSSLTFQPKTPYQLNIIPAKEMTIGGGGMMADIWGTGASTFEVPANAITSTTTGCGFVGGTTTGSGGSAGCTVTLSQFSGSLAQSLAGGSTLPVIGVNLTFYYMITHTPGATNPYNELATTNSLLLPNVRIYVGDGS